MLPVSSCSQCVNNFVCANIKCKNEINIFKVIYEQWTYICAYRYIQLYMYVCMYVPNKVGKEISHNILEYVKFPTNGAFHGNFPISTWEKYSGILTCMLEWNCYLTSIHGNHTFHLRQRTYAFKIFMHKTTYAPMIYTALCIMFWMRAYPLRGQVGGG